MENKKRYLQLIKIGICLNNKNSEYSGPVFNQNNKN